MLKRYKRTTIINSKGLSARRQRGFSLIEIGVSFMLLGVGLLGIVTMQSLGVKQNSEAFFYTQASLINEELIAVVRSDPVFTGFLLADPQCVGDVGLPGDGEDSSQSSVPEQNPSSCDLSVIKDYASTSTPGDDLTGFQQWFATYLSRNPGGNTSLLIDADRDVLLVVTRFAINVIKESDREAQATQATQTLENYQQVFVRTMAQL